MTHLSFKQKIASLVLLGLLTTLLVIAVSFVDTRNSLIATRKLELVTAVQSVHHIAVAYKERADKGQMSQEEAQKAAAQAIGLSRYGGKDGKNRVPLRLDPGGCGRHAPHQARMERAEHGGQGQGWFRR